MASIRLKNVDCFPDRYGKVRYYYRKGKGKRTPLKGVPGSTEFNLSYSEASGSYAYRQLGEKETFNYLIKLFFASNEFVKLKPRTKILTRYALESFSREHGHRKASQMQRTDVARLLAEKADTPGHANNFLKKLRALIRFAIQRELLQNDPTTGFKPFKLAKFHSWTEEELASFEAHWPLGTTYRTAYALHLYTGQRRGDVCKMQWEDIKDGAIYVKQEKTGTELRIPLHTALILALASYSNKSGTILVTSYNKPYNVETYGQAMAKAIDKAGLPKRCVLHGLRKAQGRRLTEADATVHQIAAILGNKSLHEIARYTEQANQLKLAQSAIAKLEK